MTDTTTAADAIARIEALRPRPHTCAACGIEYAAKTSEVEPITRTLLNGKPGVYGLCPVCRANPSEAAAIARLFDLDADDAVLQGLTVAWFADLAHAMPNRPNSTPWAHLALAPLAESIQARRADVDRRRGATPCAYCGTTLTNEGGTWWQQGEKSFCESCWSNLDPLNPKKDAYVNDRHTASVLCGIPSNFVGSLPMDFARQVGFRLPRPGESGDHPFAHLDLGAMRHRAREFLTSIGWRHLADYDASLKRAKPVTW